MWQQSRFRDPVIQAEFGKAFEIAFKKRLFLELIYELPDPRIFAVEGVPEGVARYFSRALDIEQFLSEQRRLGLEADSNAAEIVH
jgi:hypothetical protein